MFHNHIVFICFACVNPIIHKFFAAKIIIYNYGPLVWTPEVTMHKALKMALSTWSDATTIANQI